MTRSVVTLVALGMLAGIVAVIALEAVMRSTGSEQFCISCHAMADNPYRQLQGTKHYNNSSGVRATCADCHIPHALAPQLLRKAGAIREVWGTLTGTIDSREKYAAHAPAMKARELARLRANDSQECRQCHDARGMMLLIQSGKAQQYHQVMLDGGQTCVDCHAGIAHPENLTASPAMGAAGTAATYTQGGADSCLGCHDFSPRAPVHAVMSGSHGIAGDPGEMAGRHGCEDCHGPSDSHVSAPMQIPPQVSFGPRWDAGSSNQDLQCLACHEENVAAHWQDALHMLNDLTCVTCHDIHAEEDPVLFAGRQVQVCASCHEEQSQGIHGRRELLADSPPCSTCHNPHDHESAQHEMLDNDSAGCRGCHDPEATAALAPDDHAPKMRPVRTCLECHRGISHSLPWENATRKIDRTAE